MKKTVLIICITISFYGFSQNEKTSVTKLTEIMLNKIYSTAERAELNNYPLKLKQLDYIYSKSFQVAEHQKYTQEQFEKIDVNKYNLTRKHDEYVLIFDEASGLQLVLFSLSKMEADKKILNHSSTTDQDPANKIAK